MIINYFNKMVLQDIVETDKSKGNKVKNALNNLYELTITALDRFTPVYAIRSIIKVNKIKKESYKITNSKDKTSFKNHISSSIKNYFVGGLATLVGDAITVSIPFAPHNEDNEKKALVSIVFFGYSMIPYIDASCSFQNAKEILDKYQQINK
jgi:hypothetical protein